MVGGKGGGGGVRLRKASSSHWEEPLSRRSKYCGNDEALKRRIRLGRKPQDRAGRRSDDEWRYPDEGPEKGRR